MADPSLGEVGLIQVDRASRALDVLRDQMRAVDDYLLQQQKVPPAQIIVRNAHVQTIGVNVKFEEGQILIEVVSRGQDAQRYLPVQQSGTWVMGEEQVDE